MANNVLEKAQLYPVHEICNWPSQEAPRQNGGWTGDYGKVKATFEGKLTDVDSWHKEAIKDLSEAIMNGTVDPVTAEFNSTTGEVIRLVNGHHRVALADRLGAEMLPVMDYNDDDWDCWNEPHNSNWYGKRYNGK